MNRLHPSELRGLQFIAAQMIVGLAVFLGIGLYMHTRGTRGGVGVLVYVAVLAALASPMLAGAVRNRMMGALSAVEPMPVRKARAAVIVPLAILEAAVFLCFVAFVSTPSHWPLIAAAVPLGMMLAWFPRAT